MNEKQIIHNKIKRNTLPFLNKYHDLHKKVQFPEDIDHNNKRIEYFIE